MSVKINIHSLAHKVKKNENFKNEHKFGHHCIYAKKRRNNLITQFHEIALMTLFIAETSVHRHLLKS